MNNRLFIFLGMLAIAGCAPSKEIRTLSATTAPFVLATHASVPAVERAYAAQSARTLEEISRYEQRTKTARRDAQPIQLLWALSGTAPDKRSVALLDRVRVNDAAIRSLSAASASPASIPQPSPAVGSIGKVTKLLSDIEKGRTGGVGPVLSFGQATWKELKRLEEDAEASVDGTDASSEPSQ